MAWSACALVLVGILSISSANLLDIEKSFLADGFVKAPELNLFRETAVFHKLVDGGSHAVVVPKPFEPHTHPLHLFRTLEENQRVNPRARPEPTPDAFYRWIPMYITSLVPNSPNQQFSFNRTCFKNNTASIQWDGQKATITITVSQKSSWDCDDGYFIATPSRASIHYLRDEGRHTIEWTGTFNDDEIQDLKQNGIRIFGLADGIAYTIVDVWETLQLFLGALVEHRVPGFTAEDNLQFLKDYANYTMVERPIQVVTLNESDIHSGDFLAIIRLDGLDPMLAWGMGSHTGHTAITMWIDGVLHVCESTTNSAYWPTNGLQKTEWNQWLKQAAAANYNVVHLPLSPASRAIFNVTGALEWFNKWEGYPYGFQNMLYSWLDTPEDNFPPPVTWEAAMILFGLVDDFIPPNATYSLFAQGLNRRLGTDGLTTREAYALAATRNLSFTDLIQIPEQDDWMYFDRDLNRWGPARMCDALVTTLWIHGGLFGNVTFQATEFTNYDAYSLNIFDADYVRPPQCVKADPDSPFCQILGKYRMTLPGYNTFTPFNNMREHCPSLPPKYERPANC